MKPAPIVLFVYNRPYHTRQTVEALRKNELASDSELFIYSDAPKNSEAKQAVKEVREYIRTIDGFKKVTIIEREKNWGLAANIIDGVTKIVNEYGKIIVLEDDLVTSPYFLKFMNDALEFYKNKEKVMHISGYFFPIESSGLNDTFLIKPTTCWGWATWARAWRYFKKDVEYYIEAFDENMIKEFNLNNTNDYYSHIIANKNGEVNTWAIFWYASTFINGGLALHPKESFVKNIGHDGCGTHCSKSDKYDVKVSRMRQLEFTNKIVEDTEARKMVEKFFIGMKSSLSKRLLIFLLKKIGMYKLIKHS